MAGYQKMVVNVKSTLKTISKTLFQLNGSIQSFRLRRWSALCLWRRRLMRQRTGDASHMQSVRPGFERRDVSLSFRWPHMRTAHYTASWTLLSVNDLTVVCDHYAALLGRRITHCTPYVCPYVRSCVCPNSIMNSSGKLKMTRFPCHV